MLTELDRVHGMLAEWRTSQTGIRFSDLSKVCRVYFGEPRRKGSHLIYRTPWQGLPRVNIQDHGGDAKPYQARQVLRAINMMENRNE